MITKFAPDFTEVGSGSQLSISLIAKNIGENKATDIQVSLSGLPWETTEEEFSSPTLLGADPQFEIKGEEGIVEWTFQVPNKEVTQMYNALANLYYGYTTTSTILFKVISLSYFKSLPEKEQNTLSSGLQSIKTTSGPISVSVVADKTLVSGNDVPIVFELTNIGNGKVFKSGKTPTEETIDTLLIEVGNENVRCPTAEKEGNKFKVRLVKGEIGRLLCRLFTGDIDTTQDMVIDLKTEYRYVIEGKTSFKVLKTPYELPFWDISVSATSITLESYDGTNVRGTINMNVKNRGTETMEKIEAQASWKLPSDADFKPVIDCQKSFENIVRGDTKTFPCDFTVPVKENNKIDFRIKATTISQDDKPDNNDITPSKSFVYDAVFAETIKPVVKSTKDTEVEFDIPLRIRNTGNIKGMKIEVGINIFICADLLDSNAYLYTVDLSPDEEVVFHCSATQFITDKNEYTAFIKVLPSEADKTNNVQHFILVYQDTSPPIVDQAEIYQGTNFLSGTTYWYSGTVSIRAPASDGESGIPTTGCEYTIDGGTTWQPATYDGTYCKKNGISPGTDITINFRATNKAGLSSTGKNRIYKHTVAPTITLTAMSDGTLYTFDTWTKNDVTVTITCKENGGVNCKTIKYCADKTNECVPSVDYLQPFIVSTTDVFFSTDIKTTSGITYLRYKITDNLGTEYQDSKTIRIDKFVPYSEEILITFPGQDTSFSSLPDAIHGQANDRYVEASGLPADSIEFYIKNPQGRYWTGTQWSSTLTWIQVKHAETNGNEIISWQHSISASGIAGMYNVKSKAIDKAGNDMEGIESSFQVTT